MNDKKRIEESIYALRDYFESRGQRFIIAYQFIGEDGKDEGAFISTSATPEDYATALMCWSHTAYELLKKH